MELKKLKRIGIIILVLALLLFIFTNRANVPVYLFFITVDMPLILLMVFTALVGFALGIYTALNVGKEKKRVDEAAEGETT